MDTSDSLLGAASSGFDEPLDMLRACHEHMAAQCRTLEKLSTHLARFGCDEQAQQAAAAVLRYFDTAGRHHHADEEEDLFPMLIHSATGETQNELQTLVADLLAEHAGMERAWEALRCPLLEVAQGRDANLAAEEVADFAGCYARHIETENTHLLPMAARVLSTEQRRRLGESMAARRGVRR